MAKKYVRLLEIGSGDSYYGQTSIDEMGNHILYRDRLMAD